MKRLQVKTKNPKWDSSKFLPIVWMCAKSQYIQKIPTMLYFVQSELIFDKSQSLKFMKFFLQLGRLLLFFFGVKTSPYGGSMKATDMGIS